MTPIDPTENVKLLIEKAISHLTDLLKTEVKRIDEKMELQRDYKEKLGIAEAKRIDAIREGEAQVISQLAERIAVLEKGQYEGAGSRGGIKDMWGWMIAVVVMLVAVAGFLIPHLK